MPATEYVYNAQTGRLVLAGGATHRKLLEDGKIPKNARVYDLGPTVSHWHEQYSGKGDTKRRAAIRRKLPVCFLRPDGEKKPGFPVCDPDAAEKWEKGDKIPISCRGLESAIKSIRWAPPSERAELRAKALKLLNKYCPGTAKRSKKGTKREQEEEED